MRIAVCDDNQDDAKMLCQYITDYCNRYRYFGEIVKFGSGEALMASFSPGLFDLIFLDIFMAGMSGVDVAREIRKIDMDCLLIFITSSDLHTMDGFQVQASGYVVKPLQREQMDKAMYMCRKTFERNSRTIAVPVKDREQRISLADLLYVEVFDKNVVFHMKKGTLTARIPLDEIEARLGGEPFLRCHRSYIANMNHVTDLRDESLMMRNGDAVPMRKKGRKDVKMAVADFIAGEVIL